MSKKYSNYKIPDVNVNIEQKLLPENAHNRSLGSQIPLYIVIHEVSLGISKSPKNFNMEHYANKILNDGLNGSKIGYHFLVGDKEIYQFIKEDERTNHTGTEEGNMNSIGVERLICDGINYEYALHNQAKLIATLMVKWNIPIENVVTHRQIQKIYTPKVKNYILRCNFDEANNDLLTGLLHEYNYVLKMFKNNIKIYSEKEIELFKNVLDNIDLKEPKTNKNLIYQLYILVDLETKINKIISRANNVDYEPIEKEICGIKFYETLEPKKCPNRLLVGQHGGLKKFYREIEKCLRHQMFFEEILDSNDKKLKK